MPNYLRIFLDGYAGYANYLWYELTHPSWHNYLYWLVGLSLFFFLVEYVRPWRENQPKFRKDFWLDAFYMFFNFFLFSLLIYNAASDVVVNFFNHYIEVLFSVNLRQINPMYTWPMWAILLTGFIVRDFVQWWTHRLLHRVPRLWEFHKLHHSVEQMGFAAHLRYHWMETLVYRTIEYVPLAVLGIGLYDFFVIHIFTLAIGHYNHSNLSVSGRVTGGILGALIGLVLATGSFDAIIISDVSAVQAILLILVSSFIGTVVLGPFMKLIFNHPEMHIWHHAYEWPENYRYGVNFGLSLAIWDYLFNTAYVEKDGKDIKLGFPGVGRFPTSFRKQMIYGITRRR